MPQREPLITNQKSPANAGLLVTAQVNGRISKFEVNVMACHHIHLKFRKFPLEAE